MFNKNQNKYNLMKIFIDRKNTQELGWIDKIFIEWEIWTGLIIILAREIYIASTTLKELIYNYYIS